MVEGAPQNLQQIRSFRREQIGHIPCVQLRDGQHRYGTVVRLDRHPQRILTRGPDSLEGLSFLRGQTPAVRGGTDPSFHPHIRWGQGRVHPVHHMGALAVGPRLAGRPQEWPADRAVVPRRCPGSRVQPGRRACQRDQLRKNRGDIERPWRSDRSDIHSHDLANCL